MDARLLRVIGDGYRFRHALLREAVHGSLPPGTRSRLHLRFAQLIDEHPDYVPAERCTAEQAHHYHSAQDPPERCRRRGWRRGGPGAGESLAHSERLVMPERVPALWNRVPDARARGGREEAVRRWERTPLVLHLAEARLRAAHAALAGHDQAAARAWLGQAQGAAHGCGAVPLERSAAGPARRAGLRLGGASEPPRDRLRARRRCCGCRRWAAPTPRSPGSCSSPPRRPA
ncbi:MULTISPECIES: hypothetical protein [Nocardiopsis]|uniref:hypothetical protein n=1 Tax=Nocardiopsis TaxID=2013 RepID=UPI001F42A242|nr:MULTISPECIES: hypothetical protein [Nocardiopsis]